MAWIGVRTGLCRLPSNVGWSDIHGIACLSGIGFTMSLFIGTLAFEAPDELNAVRLGVIMGSILSVVAGVIVLRRSLTRNAEILLGAIANRH